MPKRPRKPPERWRKVRSPRFPLKGSFKGDIDIGIDVDINVDVDMDVISDMAVL